MALAGINDSNQMVVDIWVNQMSEKTILGENELQPA
jgi:hypothetical protein